MMWMFSHYLCCCVLVNLTPQLIGPEQTVRLRELWMSKHPLGFILLFWWFLSETFTRSWWRVSHVTSVTNRKEGKQDFCLLHLDSNKMKWSALWWKSEGALNNINASVEVPISQRRNANGEQMLCKIIRHYPDLTSLIVLKTDSIWDACVCTRTQGIRQLCPGCVTIIFVWQDLEPLRQELKD